MRLFALFILYTLASSNGLSHDSFETTPRLISTSETTSIFPNHIQVSFQQDDETFVVVLEKKTSIVTFHGDTNCLYSGVMKEFPSSKARFTLCHGFHGVIDFKNYSLYVYPLQNAQGKIFEEKFNQRHKFVIHDSFPEIKIEDDILRLENGTVNDDVKAWEVRSRIKRDSKMHGSHIHKTSMRFLELYLVNDHSVYEYYKGDTSVIEERCKLIADIIDERYKHLHLRIILVGVEIWAEKDMIEIKGNSYVTLMQFMRYRQNSINQKIRNDNAQLISRVPLDEGRTSGKAPIATICNKAHSAGISYDDSEHPNHVANVLAHEIGHNLGMHHDPTSCYCNEHKRSKCVMNSHVDGLVTRFSDCSSKKLEEIFSHGHGKCLSDFPTRNKKAVCGNGIIEGEEKCDCGHPENCRKFGNCCDLFKCRLFKNATCGSGGCCKDCQFKRRSTMCRHKVGDCDLEEYCTGESGHCPNDVYKQDTSSCENNRGYCLNGICMSHDHQCRDWLGTKAISADAHCYKEINIKGNKNGHCGQKKDDSFIKCSRIDTYCGKVHCVYSEKSGTLQKDVISNELFWEALQITLPCLSANIDEFIGNGNLSLVKDGTKCGNNKVCYHSKCVPTNLYREKITHFKQCVKNCSGNGVCNSQNNCHCSLGWAPPFCEKHGDGGSFDSGPMKSVNKKKHSKRPVFIITTLAGVTTLMTSVALLWRFGGKLLSKCRENSKKECEEVKSEELQGLLLEK